MTEIVTNKGLYEILNYYVANHDVRMLAFTGTATGTASKTLNTVADLDAVSGVSIHTERLTLSGETVTEDDTNHRAAYDCTNPAFAAAPGVTAQGVAIYDEGGGADSSRLLLATFSTGFPQVMDGGLTISVPDLIRSTSG